MSRKHLTRENSILHRSSIKTFMFSGKLRWLFLAMVLLTVILYSRILNQNFLYGWDDGEYIDHPTVQNLSSENTGKYFSTFYLGMYQPIPVLAFAVNYHFSARQSIAIQAFQPADPPDQRGACIFTGQETCKE
jgi:hypothetical protein